MLKEIRTCVKTVYSTVIGYIYTLFFVIINKTSLHI